jgi:hypothetical protein
MFGKITLKIALFKKKAPKNTKKETQSLLLSEPKHPEKNRMFDNPSMSNFCNSITVNG